MIGLLKLRDGRYGKNTSIYFFYITIRDFITILCHVSFTILQVVWALQPNLFPYYKDNIIKIAFNIRCLGQTGRRKKSLFLILHNMLR